MAQLIRPVRQSPSTTDILNSLTSGLELLDRKRRQTKEDEEAQKIRDLQAQQARQNLQQGQMDIQRQKAIESDIQLLQDPSLSPERQAMPDEPFEGGMGPISMDRSKELQKSADRDFRNRVTRRLSARLGRPMLEEEPEQKDGFISTQKGLLDIKKKGLEIEKLQKEIDKVARGTGDIDDKTFEIEQKLRKEFTGLSKDFIKQRDAFGRVEASGNDPSPAGDLALIFNYMKILDPNSVVRESEFATAENTGSIPDRIWKSYNKVLQGERLAPAQRQDFLNRANLLFEKAEKQHEQRIGEFGRIADQYSGLGVDRGRILINVGRSQEKPGGRFQVMDTPKNIGVGQSMEVDF